MRIISLGAGVQSTVLALLAAKGDIEPIDCAIFADTQWEPKAVYTHLEWLKKEILNNKHPFPVHTCTAGNIKKDLLRGKNSTGQKFITIPLFCKCGEKVQMGRRQCTREYKLAPLYKKTREVAGYAPRQRIPKAEIQMLLGITTDEIIRVKEARVQYIENQYPLVDENWSRQRCLDWFHENYPGRPLVKSACIGCPFRTNSEWLWLKNTSPREWRDAVKTDRKIRTVKPTVKQYLHNSAQPLSAVVLERNISSEEYTFGSECEGMCGI